MAALNVLIVDYDPAQLEAMRTMVQALGHCARVADCAQAAREQIADDGCDLVLTDLVLPGDSGLALLKELRSRPNAPPVVLVTGQASVQTAVEALKAGASDYVTKPVSPQALEEVLARLLPKPLWDEDHGPFTNCKRMRRSLERLALAAPTDAPILLRGEVGTGKKLCADWLHRRSIRHQGPFVTLPAGGLPCETVTAQLLGASGAPGKLAAATQGTLFIDQVDALQPDAQLGLLRALEAGMPVRMITASSHDLAAQVAAGRLREDLFWRLNVVSVALPPLRERKEDISALAAHFVTLFSGKYHKPALSLAPAAMERLQRHDWPGNVLELRNTLEQAVILCQELQVDADLLPLPSRPGPEVLQVPVGTAIREVERTLIVHTLDANHGNKIQTARQLGISRRSLYNKLERYRETHSEAKAP